MYKSLSIVFCLVFFILSVCAEVEIFFGPNGGFHPNNRERTITTVNGQVVTATLNNTVLDFLDRVEEGGTIKIAMYSFNYEPLQNALIRAARDRGVKVKLLMDGTADWSVNNRKEFQKMVKAAQATAENEGRDFNFQMKEITVKTMHERGRFKYEADKNKMIYGTMHEKFGICFSKNCKIPLDGFCGSANFSGSASDVYAENRIIFRNEPTIGRQLAEEFARLWNEYGTSITDNCESESFIPAITDISQIQIISNSKQVDEERTLKIDEYLISMMKLADRPGGSIDIAIFSFTHQGLCDRILEIAKRQPKMKVRIIMDQCQIENDETHPGALGAYLIDASQKFPNVQIRFKWRSNAYGWDTQRMVPDLIHLRNPLWHHKCMIVNRNRMALGSYNWSFAAEFRNFENVMLFHGDVPTHAEIIGRFLNEFDYVWGRIKKDGLLTEAVDLPVVVSGERGQVLKEQILRTFADPICRRIMLQLEGYNDGISEESLLQKMRIPVEVLRQKCKTLQNATLIFQKEKNGTIFYQIAD